MSPGQVFILYINELFQLQYEKDIQYRKKKGNYKRWANAVTCSITYAQNKAYFSSGCFKVNNS